MQQGKQGQGLVSQTEQEVIPSSIQSSISFNRISPKVRYKKVHLKSLMRHRCLKKDNYAPLKLDISGKWDESDSGGIYPSSPTIY